MSDNEALEAMIKGQKVTHRYFDKNEYAYIKFGEVFTEDGVRHADFWELREGDGWKDGWEIFIEQNTTQP